mgnify:CR=1 FL=1
MYNGYTKVTIHYWMSDGKEYTKTLPLSKKVQEFCNEHGSEHLEIFANSNLILITSFWNGEILQKAKIPQHGICHFNCVISSYEWIE